MNRFIGLGFALLLSGAISAQSQGYEKLSALLRAVKYQYVDTVNEDKIVDDAIRGMLKELDPHSVYIPADEVRRMNEPLVGNFDGIGVQFNIVDDTVMVVSPIPGGPSEKLGIRSGDRIVEVNYDKMAGTGIKNSDVMKLLRGKKGTKVNVGIYRRGEEELLDFTITRDKIPIYSVDASYMMTPEIGYIKVNRFARKTADEFTEGLIKLKGEGMKHLVVDLRGNGGGYLRTAEHLADQLLADKKLIVYTQGVHQDRRNLVATGRGLFEKGKLVVLIDEGSASASEIVSGAVQDHDRGLIVGRRSFGKGLVQKPMPLPDGSMVRLTTARYYTPTGRCIQKSYEGGKEEYYKDLEKRFKGGELMHQDSVHFPDSLKFYTPNKRIVYGGGGIMPDYFVGLDTTYNSRYYSQVVRKGIMNDFTFSYLDAHRDEIKAKYETFEAFKVGWKADDKFMKEFTDYAASKKVELNEKEYNRSKPMMKAQLKALIARPIWDASAYYSIINELDKTCDKAIEIIEDNTFKKAGLSYK